MVHVNISITQDSSFAGENNLMDLFREEGFFNAKEAVLSINGEFISNTLNDCDATISLFDASGHTLSTRKAKWESQEVHKCVKQLVSDLLSIATDHTIALEKRAIAARVLKNIPGQEDAEAAAWKSIATDPQVSIEKRLEALRDLVGLKDQEEIAASVCAQMIEENASLTALASGKIEYSKILLLGNDGHRELAKALLLSLAHGDGGKAFDRLEAFIILAEVGLVQAQEFCDYAKTIYNNVDATVATRVNAANVMALSLVQSGDYQEAMTKWIHKMLSDDTLSQGAISVLSSLARFAAAHGHEEWAAYMLIERLKIRQAIVGLQTKQTYSALAQEIFTEAFSKQKSSSADRVAHLGHYVEDPHIGIWQGNLPLVPQGYKDEALWVANKEKLMYAVSYWYNRDPLLDKSISLDAYREVIGRFYDNLKQTKDYKVDPEAVLARVARLISHLDGIGRGHRDSMDTKELAHLGSVFKELNRRGPNCADAAAVGLDYAQMHMLAWDNRHNEKALLSIALTFIKRASLQQFSMRPVDAAAQNPETVEDWLYALNQYSVFCDLGVLGCGTMEYESQAVKESFDKVWSLFLNAANEEQLVEGVIYCPNKAVSEWLLKASGLQIREVPRSEDYPALSKWLEDALYALADLADKDKKSIRELYDDVITRSLEGLDQSQKMPDAFEPYKEKTIEVVKKQVRGLSPEFSKKLTSEFLSGGVDEGYAFIQGTLCESIKRSIESAEHVDFKDYIKAKLVEYGYLTDKNAANYRGAIPQKLKVEALQEIAFYADAMPENPGNMNNNRLIQV